MGAESSVQRDGKSQEEDASAAASGAELSAELEVLDCKPLQKNGQISSVSSLNGHSEDKTLAEVGQPDAVSVPQKEETSETADTSQDEVVPQVNGEKVEKESPDANDIAAVEEKAGEEKPDDATEVGFKKIFRFVGFKFTLKKDKSEEKDPVKLLTVKEKDGEELSGTDEPAKEEAVTAEEKSTAEEKEADTEATAVEAELTEDKTETTDAPAEEAANGDTDEAVKEEESSPPSQETTLTLSPFRKLFGGGIFSNLRKKASIKKTKEEEEDKEAVVEEEAAKSEESAAAEEEKVDAENQEVAATTPEEEKSEPKEEAAVTPDSVKSEATPTSEETPAASAATSDETKQEEEKAEEEKAPAEVTSEVDLLSSQEKVKPQGSPLKKLFTGAGLKKLSTKKQKNKKDSESKLTESGEAEQLQSSTESAEAPKSDSGPSSPEESGEHVLAVEVTQNESSQEADGEVASDGEKKKEGIIAWSSFKRLVTPKKLVKRSSESDDEATGEKPASPSESAPLADKSVEEEAAEEKPAEEEPKTENTEKLVSSTEEPKKKMDTSVSWEALMCMGGTKKRTRRTSDSDDEETKIEEEAAVAESVAEVEQEVKPEAAPVTSASQNAESDGEVASSPEPLSPPERESTWDTLKRMVMPKSKPKVEEKPEESANQVQSDSEAPKEESSFSLRKLFPGRRKKKVEKQSSTEAGEEDTDTPAVVPLSEYDEQVEPKQETPAEIQIKDSSEDRSPSWIPASVGDADNNPDQLSDIPEEAENAATPKSVDTDIVDDDDEAMPPSKAAGRMGRRLSTAEVKPIDQAPAGETTFVPQGPTSGNAKEVVEALEAQISEVPSQTSVTVVDVPLEAASEKTEDELPVEQAEVTSNTILQPHAPDEAMAICTGLGTKEIAKVALEKPASPIIESMAVVRDGLGTEVLMEDKPASPEEAKVTEDAVSIAQVQQVDTTDLEPSVEVSQDDEADVQVATESREPEIEAIGVVTTLLEESVVLHSTTVSENSPKSEIVDPITPTSETAICTQSVEVTELTVETKGVKMDMEPLDVATEENAPITEVIQAVNEEISSTMCSTTMATITKETVVITSEEVPVITETVVGIAPVILESDQKESSEEVTVKEEAVVAETLEASSVEVVEPESCALIKQATEKIEEIQDEVQQGSEIETQSQVIAQAILQDAMDKVSETTPEPQEPETTPSPVQATAGTEEEIVTDNIVITDTPVPVICEKPAPKSPPQLHVAMEVTDTVTLEVTESLDAPVEVEEQKKPERELKQAVEVKVSEEETIVVEEVIEVVAEVEKEQSKEEEEEKPQSEESEEHKEKELHMPVQVVLQTAHMVEEQVVEEEVAVEFDSNGPVNDIASAGRTSPVKKLSTLSEEAQDTASAAVPQAAAEQPEKTTSGKCAEVMAQVMEVIEEAVKEIEPVSTEITATS